MTNLYGPKIPEEAEQLGSLEEEVVVAMVVEAEAKAPLRQEHPR